MNKSGGSTIKGMLELWGAYNGVSIGTYSAKTWTQGTERAQSFWDEGYPITVGGYTEIFRARGAADCKWFTVFRHPLPRLVSAYMYCRSPMVKDQLCGSKIVNAREVDIVTFAQHWGNFGLRQFALAFVLPEEVTNSPLAKECPRCAPWYLVKQYLDETDVSKGGGVDEALIRYAHSGRTGRVGRRGNSIPAGGRLHSDNWVIYCRSTCQLVPAGRKFSHTYVLHRMLDTYELLSSWDEG